VPRNENSSSEGDESEGIWKCWRQARMPQMNKHSLRSGTIPTALAIARLQDPPPPSPPFKGARPCVWMSGVTALLN
jgi:hypothetical protein